jgi:hypothetical protein
MKLSLAETLADKHRTSVAKVIRKYQTTVPTPLLAIIIFDTGPIGR